MTAQRTLDRQRPQGVVRRLRDRLVVAFEPSRTSPARALPRRARTFELTTGPRGRRRGVMGMLRGASSKNAAFTSSRDGRSPPRGADHAGHGGRTQRCGVSRSPHAHRGCGVHMNTRSSPRAISPGSRRRRPTPLLETQRSDDAPDALAFHAALRRPAIPSPRLVSPSTGLCDEYFFCSPASRAASAEFSDRHNSGDPTATSPSPARSARRCSIYRNRRHRWTSPGRRRPRGTARPQRTLCRVNRSMIAARLRSETGGNIASILRPCARGEMAIAQLVLHRPSRRRRIRKV